MDSGQRSLEFCQGFNFTSPLSVREYHQQLAELGLVQILALPSECKSSHLPRVQKVTQYRFDLLGNYEPQAAYFKDTSCLGDQLWSHHAQHQT